MSHNNRIIEVISVYQIVHSIVYQVHLVVCHMVRGAALLYCDNDVLIL